MGLNINNLSLSYSLNLWISISIPFHQNLKKCLKCIFSWITCSSIDPCWHGEKPWHRSKPVLFSISNSKILSVWLVLIRVALVRTSKHLLSFLRSLSQGLHTFTSTSSFYFLRKLQKRFANILDLNLDHIKFNDTVVQKIFPKGTYAFSYYLWMW